jgi:peptide subunit release factor 1 (eRF1)
VDELLVSASAQEIRFEEELDEVRFNQNSQGQPFLPGRDSNLMTADLLVSLAQQTGARITFIEDSALLGNVGGVGAMLRYRS